MEPGNKRSTRVVAKKEIMVDYSETTGATRLKSWHRINPNVDCVQGNYVSRSLLDPLPSANIPNT